MIDEDLDDQFAEWLAAYDEALARGDPTPEHAVPPHLLPRLERARACLRLLGAALSRGEATTLDRPDSPEATQPSPAGDRPLAERFSRFEILAELGRGGFGVVYLAFDPKLGRKVALKIPRVEALASASARRRFFQEARAAAQLDHPNVVPVYEVGEFGPECFIASAFCEGDTLAEWIGKSGGAVPPRLAARVAIGLAEGVQHAHDRKILHRDLKPANALLQRRAPGEYPDGLAFTPRVVDFGLARLMDQPGEDFPSGMPIGTPSYMPPEQAEGRRRDIGPAADVYGLGAILYTLLTGQPPFRGETIPETLRHVVQDDPIPPRRLRPAVPRDLETICLACLRKEPQKRYASARELADDLGRFLDGAPIRARRVGPFEKLAKAIRRRPSAAALIAVSLTGLAALGFAAWRREAELRAATLDRVADLVNAPIADVPRKIDRLAEVHPREVSLLESIARPAPPDSRLRLRAELALLPGQPSRAEPLVRRLLAAPPEEFGVILDRLRRHDRGLVPRLSAALRDPATPAEGRLRAASALIALGDDAGAEAPWDLLRHTERPQFRTDLIHWLAPSGCPAEVLIHRLDVESDVSIRRALVLALSEYGPRALPASAVDPLVARLEALYRDEPDAGLHSCAAYLLRRWGRANRLADIDRELIARGHREGQGWFLNSIGQTMIVFAHRREFLMGSPRDEPGRAAWERLPERTVVEPFAIGATEVTWAQYQTFDPGHRPPSGRAVAPDEPVVYLSYHDAVAFCEWLSRREGRVYRLATAAELEFATRAGSVTSRYCGEAEESLKHYERHSANTAGHPSAVGSLKPNDFGLFDTLGNVREWSDEIHAQRVEEDGRLIDRPYAVEGQVFYVQRGGAFYSLPPFLRSAYTTSGVSPKDRPIDVGIRLAMSPR